MNESSKTYWTDDPEMVERYVLGQCTPEEKKRLDDEIAGCEPCRAQLEREMQIAAGIRLHGRTALKSRLQKKIRNDKFYWTNRYQIIGLAAAVVIVALAVGAYQMWFTSIEPQKKFGSTEIVLQYPAQEEDRRAEETQAEKSEDSTFADVQSESEISAAPEEITDADASPAAGAASEQQTASKSIAAKKISPSAQRRTKTVTPDDAKDFAAAEALPAASPPQSAPILAMGKSIWLLGSIEVISDSPAGASAKSESRLSKERSGRSMESSSARRSKSVTVQRRSGTEEVVLQQRSFAELPRSRQTQLGKTNRIETYIEQKKDGLIVTIFSDALTSDDIDRAEVESPSEDSLIIVTSTQKIIYRLPSEALFRQPARR
ncbi:MAG: anti-sigma factor family protein [Bacteroidota bacterium]